MFSFFISGPVRHLRSPRPLVRLWPHVRRFRLPLTLASLTLTASAAVGLVFPLIVRSLLDAALLGSNPAFLERVVLSLFGLSAVYAVLNYVQTYILNATGERAVAGLRRELFSRLLEMPPGFFADRRTGELISRITTDIGLLQGLLSTQIAELSRQTLSLVGGVAILTYMQPRLTLTALGVLPIVVGTAIFVGRRLRRITMTVQDKVAEASAVAAEAFSQIRTVQSFVQEPAERRRYGERVQAMVDAAIRRASIRGMFLEGVTFTTFAGAGVMLWQGGLMVLAGKLSPGALVAFFIYALLVVRAVGVLVGSFSYYQEAVGAAQRVFEILEAPSPIADPDDPVPLPKLVHGRIVYENVSLRYERDPRAPYALRQINLHLAPGEVVAIVGPSGAGKTSLISLLLRFWDVTEGRILLDGVDLRALRLVDLRGSIGLVQQEPTLFSGSIRENIAYARPDAPAAEVEAAARAAHAHEFIQRLPQGYDTLVGERGVKLSGGQRQRVAIARVILKDPAVLILDEATSNLDTESERLVEEALERLLVGRTTLIIAHRLSTVRRADRLIVLNRGRMVEEGTHRELLALGGLYARLYQRQFRGEEEAAASS